MEVTGKEKLSIECFGYSMDQELEQNSELTGRELQDHFDLNVERSTVKNKCTEWPNIPPVDLSP